MIRETIRAPRRWNRPGCNGIAGSPGRWWLPIACACRKGRGWSLRGTVAAVDRIIDPDDGRLDPYRRLNDVGFRRRFEAASGLFIAEGLAVVTRLLGSELGAESVLCLESAHHRLPATGSVPVFVVDRQTMSAVVGFDLHRGVVASARRPDPAPVASLLELASLAVIEGVNDHENLGAVLRAAVGLGMAGVLVDPTTADPWYRRSVRVSMGALFSVPIARSLSWAADLAAVKRAGFTLVAMTPAPDATPIGEIAVGRPAVMVGAEGPGLSDTAMQAADVRVRIPLTGIDSLNVGQAAAIAYAALHTARDQGAGGSLPGGSLPGGRLTGGR